jgi:hypothetical protein
MAKHDDLGVEARFFDHPRESSRSSRSLWSTIFCRGHVCWLGAEQWDMPICSRGRGGI